MEYCNHVKRLFIQYYASFSVASTESQVSPVIFNEKPAEKNVTGLLCQKEKAVFIKHPLPYCSAAAFLSSPETEALPRIIATLGCDILWKILFTLKWELTSSISATLWMTHFPSLSLCFLLVLRSFSVREFRCLHISSMLFQDEVWPRWVGGVFPARRWAEETARVGCGEREMQRVTFLKNGRSTGLFWKTTACTGTSMKRYVSKLMLRFLLAQKWCFSKGGITTVGT